MTEARWITIRTFELPNGRFLAAALAEGETLSVRTFYACGSCGGSGCGACNERGFTQEVQPDRIVELQREVSRYRLQLDLVKAICKGIRVDVDLALFSASVRRSVAERAARFTLGELGMSDDRRLCAGMASWLFAGEPEITRSSAEVKAGQVMQDLEKKPEVPEDDDVDDEP